MKADKTVLFKDSKKKHQSVVYTLPFCGASAVTVEKSQGLTLEGVVIGDLGRRKADKQAMYVAMSRVVALDYVFFLHMVTDAYLREFTRKDLVEIREGREAIKKMQRRLEKEEKRLKQMERRPIN